MSPMLNPKFQTRVDDPGAERPEPIGEVIFLAERNLSKRHTDNDKLNDHKIFSNNADEVSDTTYRVSRVDHKIAQINLNLYKKEPLNLQSSGESGYPRYENSNPSITNKDLNNSLINEKFYIAKIPISLSTEEEEKALAPARALGITFEHAAYPPRETEVSLEKLALTESGVGKSTPAAASAPPLEDGTHALWANRSTGRILEDRKLSSIEWIKKYYDHLVGEVDADTGRLNRERLAQADPGLARAYSSTIRSNASRALPGLPLLPRHPVESTQEALKRRKDQEREASARYRAKTRTI